MLRGAGDSGNEAFPRRPPFPGGQGSQRMWPCGSFCTGHSSPENMDTLLIYHRNDMELIYIRVLKTVAITGKSVLYLKGLNKII